MSTATLSSGSMSSAAVDCGMGRGTKVSVVARAAEDVTDLLYLEESGEQNGLAPSQARKDVLGVSAWNDAGEVFDEGSGVGGRPPVAVEAIGADEGDVLEVTLMLAFREKRGDCTQGEHSGHGASVISKALHKLKAGQRHWKCSRLVLGRSECPQPANGRRIASDRRMR